MAKLNIVGVGPGSADYVTPAAHRAVQQAQLVIGAQRSLNLFTADIKGEKIILTAKNLNTALKQAATATKNGKNVALLSTGDPGFSGLLHTALESGLFNADDINVVPGVSSLQACAARLVMSWGDARLFTFHEGDVNDSEKQELASALKAGRSVMVLPSVRAFAPKDIASYLITAGLDRDTPVYVCENLTLDTERITVSSLGNVAEQTFGSLCVMVIKSNHR